MRKGGRNEGTKKRRKGRKRSDQVELNDTEEVQEATD